MGERRSKARRERERAIPSHSAPKNRPDTEIEAGHHRGPVDTRSRSRRPSSPAETEAHHHLETTTRIDYLFKRGLEGAAGFGCRTAGGL